MQTSSSADAVRKHRNSQTNEPEAALTIGLAKMGPFGFAIDLGLAVGTFISNTGELDEKTLNTIALGDAASAYVAYMKTQLAHDTANYYFVNSENYNQLQLLGQLRICGENSFCETADSRGVVMKLIDRIFGGSQKEIEGYCKDTIDRVRNVCDNIGVYINPNYEGAFFK